MSLLSPSRKGKERAHDGGEGGDGEFAELAPVITYRHLLDKNIGPRNPLRVVALCDSDAFYAACERVRLGIDPELPLVVQQWDSLIAINYPARKFGISRMDKVKEAKKRCPELISVHVATYREGDSEPGYWPDVDTRTHKVSLDLYRRESAKILAVFKEVVPSAEIEKASIDEAFVDFTAPVLAALRDRIGDPPDGALDHELPPPPLEIAWDGLGAIIPVHPLKEGEQPPEEPQAEPPPTWHDVALSIAAEWMAKVRQEVLSRLGYTMSAGIARNKFLAKLSASYKKPNTQNVLRNAAIPNYLRPMPFQKIRFLGGKLGKALAEEYDAQTVGDLLTISLDEMQRKFGEESLWVWEVLRGTDRSEVKEKPVLNKSMLASKNLPQPVHTYDEGTHWLRVLAAELALRLTEARTQTPGLWPKTLTLHTKARGEPGHSKQAPFPFVRDLTADVVRTAAERLWREASGIGSGANGAPRKLQVTHLMLGFGGIEARDAGQRDIAGFLAPKPLSAAAAGAGDAPNEDRCARCGAALVTEAARTEHEDWHFARDLAQEDAAAANPAPSKRKSESTGAGAGKKGKKAKTESAGIARYFSKK